MKREPIQRNKSGPRGPANHVTRDQIVNAAEAHFRHYGYTKTTVADLARSIGISKSYIYKFFESKRAIADAIAVAWLTPLTNEIDALIVSDHSPADKLLGIYRVLARRGRELFFFDDTLYELVAAAAREQWPALERHVEHIGACVRTIVVEGRDSGDFERKTPLDETCRAIIQTLKPVMDPLILQQELADIDKNLPALSALVIRGLAR